MNVYGTMLPVVEPDIKLTWHLPSIFPPSQNDSHSTLSLPSPFSAFILPPGASLGVSDIRRILTLSFLSFSPIQSSCPSVTPSLLPNPPTRKNERSITMSLDSSHSLSEDFLDSCEDASRTRGSWFSPTAPSTLVRLSFTTYHVAQLKFDEDDEAYVSGPVRTGPESQRIIREARDVHGHPMQAVWSELGERVCALHDGHKVRWTSIDVVAFAEAGKRTFSLPLIWIGIEPGSLAYELVNTAAEAVHFLLTEAGFRESVITCSVDGPKMLSVGPFNHSVREYGKHFTPALGLSIAPLKTPHFEGTGALYLRESKDSKRVFLLTCAHVARPPPVNQNKGLASKTKSHPREKVIVHGRLGYRSVCTSMIRAIGNLDNSIRVWQAVLRPLGEPEEGEDESTKRRRDMHLARVEGARWEIGRLTSFAPRSSNDGPNRNTVLLARSYTSSPSKSASHLNGSQRTGLSSSSTTKSSTGTRSRETNTMFPQPEDRAKYGYPIDGLQALGGIQPEEINNPQQLDVNGEPCLLVVKNDRTTGTSIGRATGMESFIRIYKEYGIEETSKEIAVLPYNNKTGPFSAPGDSGSIVLDRNGRILGVITAGAGVTDSTDVTYVTVTVLL
nr:hypothetical protein L204_04748 [Cryptococcus depauperatus CBS 7855]